MKHFSCGDIVPNCAWTFSAPDEGALLSQVAAHAAADHDIAEVSPELAEQVRGRITED